MAAASVPLVEGVLAAAWEAKGAFVGAGEEASWVVGSPAIEIGYMDAVACLVTLEGRAVDIGLAVEMAVRLTETIPVVGEGPAWPDIFGNGDAVISLDFFAVDGEMAKKAERPMTAIMSQAAPTFSLFAEFRIGTCCRIFQGLEASTTTVNAHKPKINALRFPPMPARINMAIRP